MQSLLGLNQKIKLLLQCSLLSICLTIAILPDTAFAEKVASTAQAQTVQDTFGRDTPRDSVQGLLKALAQDDKQLASNYLALKYQKDADNHVQELKKALDSGGRLQGELQISNEPAGNLEDKLAPNLDKVGEITPANKQTEIDILMERVTLSNGTQVWLVAEDTLKNIQTLGTNLHPTLVERYIPNELINQNIKGYSIGHILAVGGVLIATYAMSLLLSLLLYWLFLAVFKLTNRNKDPDEKPRAVPIDKRVIVPIAMIFTGIIIQELMLIVGINLAVRNVVERLADILSWVSSVWLLLRILDIVFNPLERIAIENNLSERVSVLNLLRKVIKALLLILATIVILGNLGFDLTTGLTALGIGGLALALGAQKTIENLVGSLSLVADQPVNVGDYCVFGNQEGTVEDIGIRSTRIRTTDRTVVTIPNGNFSSMSIENFSQRDMFHFKQQFYVSRDSDTKLLQTFLEEVQLYIVNHPTTNNTWNQVRIASTQQDAYIVEVRCYLNVKGVMDFNEKQTGMILRIAEMMQELGLQNALPTSHIKVDNTFKNSEHKAEKS